METFDVYPICGNGKLTKQTTKEEFSFAGFTITISNCVTYKCNKCDEEIVDPKTLEEIGKILKEWRNKANDLLTKKNDQVPKKEKQIISIREFLERYDSGEFDSSDVETQIKAGWYDWFCKDEMLHKKTKRLVQKLKSIIKTKKFDIDKTYVFFKNNRPIMGSLYDDFRICDIENRRVLYTVIPSSGHRVDKGKAVVYGHENDFEEPLVVGTWRDVKRFFSKD